MGKSIEYGVQSPKGSGFDRRPNGTGGSLSRLSGKEGMKGNGHAYTQKKKQGVSGNGRNSGAPKQKYDK